MTFRGPNVGSLVLQNAAAPRQGPKSGWAAWGGRAAPPGGEFHRPASTMALRRFVIQLLEDLVFFVSDVPNNGQNVLDIVVTKPNRERQKLMREQNILKQVSGPGAPEHG